MVERSSLAAWISSNSNQKTSDNTCDMFGAKTASCPYPKDPEHMVVRLNSEKASPRTFNTTTKRGLSEDRRYGSILAFRADYVA